MEVIFLVVAIDGNDWSTETKLLFSHSFRLWVTHSSEGDACSYSQHCERQHSAHEDYPSVIFIAVLAFPLTDTLF